MALQLEHSENWHCQIFAELLAGLSDETASTTRSGIGIIIDEEYRVNNILSNLSEETKEVIRKKQNSFKINLFKHADHTAKYEQKTKGSNGINRKVNLVASVDFSDTKGSCGCKV